MSRWRISGTPKGFFGGNFASAGACAGQSCGDARRPMFSHVVIFWIKPEAAPDAADQLLAGCQQYLTDLPGVLSFHAGKMVSSPRAVVDQSYQVGLNVVFADKAAEAAYQVHPRHLEFIDKVFKPLCERATIFDFA